MDGSHYNRLVLLVALVLLANCAAPPGAHVPRPTVAYTPLARVVAVPSPTISIATATATVTTPPMVTYAPLPATWHRVVWQGLSIPLPAEARTILPIPPASATLHNLPILAAGYLDLPVPPTPTNDAIGEYPAPPSFTLFQFSGTLDAWILLEEQALTGVPEGGVQEPIASLTIAGREARHYHRTVFGFSYNDYYIFKPTATTLLLIYTDKERYGPLINGLAVAAP